MNDKDARWHDYFMRVAEVTATMSKDPSSKVGAVLVDFDTRRIVGTGFNGFPRGLPDDPALLANRDEKYPRVIHAEVNALINADGLRWCKRLHIYVYGLPICERCASHLVQSNVVELYAAFPSPPQRAVEAARRTADIVAAAGARLRQVVI